MTWIPSAKRVVSSDFRLIFPESMFRHVNAYNVMVFVVLSEASKATSYLLVLLPKEAASLHGEPVEGIQFSGDAIANAAWALRQLMPGPSGRPRDRHELWQHSRPGPDPASGILLEAALSDQLATALPAYWLPLLNEPAPRRTNRSTQLRLAAFAAPLGTMVYHGLPMHEESLIGIGVGAPTSQTNPISRRPGPYLDCKAKMATHRAPLRRPAQRLSRRVASAD